MPVPPPSNLITPSGTSRSVRNVSAAIAFCLAGILTVLVHPTRGFGFQSDSIAVRTIEGLQQRRLFDLALHHAEQQLGQETDEAERADLAVALIDVLTTRAVAAGAETREAAWREARNRGAALEETFRTHPRGLLVAAQLAFVDLAQLEQRVRERQLGGSAPETDAEINELARRVDKGIEAVGDRLAIELAQSNTSRDPERLSSETLLTLRYNLDYQAARSLLHRGWLYPETQMSSRADLMTRAESRFSTCLLSTGPTRPLWWAIQADRLQAARAMQDWDRFQAVVAELNSEPPDERSRLQVLAEQILGLLARQRQAELRRLCGEDTTASEHPELDVARLQAMASLVGDTSGEGTNWQERALQLARAIEARHGDWWGRRANQVLVASPGAVDGGGNLDMLVRVATEAQRAGQWSDAIIALDAAAEQAKKENNPDMAFRLAFRAAAIAQDQTDHALAANRFESLAKAFPENDEAPSAALLAGWNLSRTVGNDLDKLEHYQAVLEWQVTTWPDAAETDQARFWLAGILARQSDTEAALGLLLGIRSTGDLYRSTLTLIRQLLPSRIEKAQQNGEDISILLSAIGSGIEARLDAARASASADGQDKATPLTLGWKPEAQLLLGELRWLYGVDELTDVAAALQRTADDSEATEFRAACRVVGIVAQTRGADLEVNIDSALQAIGESTEASRRLRTGLAGTYSGVPPSDEGLRMLLVAAEKLKPRDTSQRAQRWERYQWDLMVLKAHRELDTPESESAIATIATQYSTNAPVQLQFGEYLLRRAAQEADTVPRALDQWRRIARITERQSSDWFRAKYEVARLMKELGQTDEAQKLLEYLNAVPPGWTGSEWAPQLESLLESIKAGR